MTVDGSPYTYAPAAKRRLMTVDGTAYSPDDVLTSRKTPFGDGGRIAIFPE
jgi:hypothetical protein